MDLSQSNTNSNCINNNNSSENNRNGRISNNAIPIYQVYLGGISASVNVKSLPPSPTTNTAIYQQSSVVRRIMPRNSQQHQDNQIKRSPSILMNHHSLAPSSAAPSTVIPSPVDLSNRNTNVYNNNNYQNSHTDILPLTTHSTTTTASSFPSSGRTNSNNDRVPFLFADDHDRIPRNAQMLGDRYLMLNQITGSSFYECIDVRNGDSLTCKAIGICYSKILSAYFRMDGHPHIKPLHKLYQTSDQSYLLLPPSYYGDLHSYVRERKRLREPEARHLFRQICKTVKSCHQQGIVLRDLKLRKFVFSNCERTNLQFESLEDAVVLEDPDDDILKEKIGCPAYVAPEILRPNSDFSGKAADLWSLGVILYTMLIGRYPFNDPEHASLFAKIARCHFIIPDYVSPKARCLIKSLLQKVPKNRLTSDDILHHPWLRENDNDFVIMDNSSILNATNNYNSSANYMNSMSMQINDLSNDDQRVPELDCLELT